MLNGHTDINALTRRWKRDPWTPSLEGDRLYGHGVPPDAEPERAVLYTNCTVSKRTFPNGYATAYLV
jgi:hypothetical protein